jgi:hypothetical protein
VEEVEAFQRVLHFAEMRAEVEEVEALITSRSAKDRTRCCLRDSCEGELPS